jgi:hypothetical protein
VADFSILGANYKEIFISKLAEFCKLEKHLSIQTNPTILPFAWVIYVDHHISWNAISYD